MANTMSSRLVDILNRVYQDAGLELLILPIIVVSVVAHVWGTKTNRRIARQWMAAHAPLLRQEYAQVGFHRRPARSSEENELSPDELQQPSTDDILKERSPQDFYTYATGRRNVAFTDVKLALHRRNNPIVWAAELFLSTFTDSVVPSRERVEIIAYPFDGREAEVVPAATGAKSTSSSSTYDGFVWAVVHKDAMRRLRDERYDVSLTITRDHAKLPPWTTVMSESAEITDAMVTPGLVEALQAAGDQFEYLIVTDQPLDRPVKVEDTAPKKRVYFSTRLAGNSTSPESVYSSSSAIFSYFLRLPDRLVAGGRLRPEVLRKIRQARDEQINRLQRVDQEEKDSERALKRDKGKKEKRDAMLKGLSADDQRKFLEREREKEMRKSQKKMSMRA